MKRHYISELDAKQVWDHYLESGSVHRTGEAFGFRGDSIKKLLNLSGYKLKNAKWSNHELLILREYYSNTSYEYFNIEEIAQKLKRTEDAVIIKAGRALGLTDKNRKASLIAKKKMSVSQKKYGSQEGEGGKRSERVKKWYKENDHPRGMLGKKHSEETKKILSQKCGRTPTPESIERGLKTKIKRYGKLGNTISRLNSTWKSGWREIKGRRIFFRSRWEFNYALFLQMLKERGEIKEWEHEPETFWFEKIKRGVRSYLPDFLLTNKDGTNEYHEVKGWMDSRSRTTIRRMHKYYPEIKLIIITEKWFKENAPALSGILIGWELNSKGRSW